LRYNQSDRYWRTCGLPSEPENAMSLETEIKTYEEKLPELLANEGKFVLIHNDQVAGFFDTYADAIQAGYERFELNPFLVKRVAALEQVQFVTIGVPCHI
jgi:hypothetical protein